MKNSEIPIGFLKELATEKGVSNAELEVVVFALQGQAIAAISEALEISQVAVRKRLGEVYKKFQIKGSGPGKLNELKQILLDRYQASHALQARQHQDWGDAVNIDVFYGREAELDDLERWIVEDRCRLVAVLGMGGIGKTALVLELASRIKDQFDFVIWRSLYNRPPLEKVLEDLIRVLSNRQERELPSNLEGQFARLIQYLRQYRCLLILDNAETILQSGNLAGQYSQEGLGYGQLLQRIATGQIGDDPHQSCLLLTSREKPQEIAALEGEQLPVRSLQLRGLGETAKQILNVKGLVGSDEHERQLVNRYMGNPLALKLAATTIKDLFDGKISEFLAESPIVFGGVRNLLDEQFNRLSGVEKTVIYWLAINREEQVSLSKLRGDILPPISPNQLQEVLQSLAQRSLIEVNSGLFRLHSVVEEYVTNHVVERVYRDILTLDVSIAKPSIQLTELNPELASSPPPIPLLCSHALLKARAKDYIRTSQVAIVVTPLLDRLIATLGSKQAVEARLKQLLDWIRAKPSLEVGYAGGNILNLLRYLDIDLSGYDLSQLTIREAYLQGINLQGVNLALANVLKSVFSEIFGYILSVAFSSDGKLLAMGDTSDAIRLWLVAENEQLFPYEGHSDWVRSVAFSSDNRLLASGSDDCTIRLWDVSTGHCLNSLQGHTDWVRSVAFSPDSAVLASGGSDKTVRLWDINTGQCLSSLSGHEEAVRSVAFSPTGKVLASASGDRTIKLWDVNTGQCLHTLREHVKAVRSAVFSKDGTLLASGSSDQTVKLWQIRPTPPNPAADVSTSPDGFTVHCIHTLKGHTSRVRSVTFSPDGRSLASGGDDRMVRLWDLNTGRSLKRLQGHTSRIVSVAFSSDGHTLASGSDDQTVRLWDISTGQPAQTLQGYTMQLCSVAFSPDGQLLASGGDDQVVRVWDVKTQQCLKTLSGHTSRIWSLAFSPDGQTLASASSDQTIRLWWVGTGQCLNVLQEHTDQVRTVAFSPDGKRLVSGSDDKTVRIWNLPTGDHSTVLLQHDEKVRSISLSPNGHLLASASSDQTVKLWDIHADSPPDVLAKDTGWIRSVAFSPDGQLLAIAGGSNHTIKLWNIETRECVNYLQGHRGRIQSVVFSPSGQILASGSDDKTIKLWDVATGICLKTLEGHSDWVRSLAFSPDGQILASGSKDETIQLWDLQTATALEPLRAKRPYDGMNITGITGLTDNQKASLIALGALESSK